MRAKTKTAAMAAACAALLVALPARAADTCDAMAAMDPASIANGLLAMSPDVLGKPADLWTEQDFRNLLGNAAACDGKPKGMKYRVDFAFWRNRLSLPMERLLPISTRTAAIRDAYAPRWAWGAPPSCVEVLGWKRDPVWLNDNAEEIFGSTLVGLGNEGRRLASGFAKECQSVMEAALAANRMDVSAASRIAEDIADSVEREDAAAEERPGDLAESLRVTHEGRRIPLSYIAPASRRMVEAASHAETNGIKLTTEQMIMLSTWADGWRMRQGPDSLYAEAVRKVVSKHMFGR